MQARLVSGGELGFEALVYNQPDQRILNYLQNGINTAAAKFQETNTGFIDNARSLYENFNGSAVLNAAKAIVGTIDNHLNPDVILSLNEETIFNPMPVMQQYMMVQPDLWELNRNQMCSAYDGMYYNTEPNVKSYEDHTKYQEVMDGIMQIDEESDESYFITYSGSDMEDLHFMDQMSIMNSWSVASDLISQDIDPSSPDQEEL